MGRWANDYFLSRVSWDRIIIKREGHMNKSEYYLIIIEPDEENYDVYYQGKTQVMPYGTPNIIPNPTFDSSHETLHDALNYIEEMNGDSDLY